MHEFIIWLICLAMIGPADELTVIPQRLRADKPGWVIENKGAEEQLSEVEIELIALVTMGEAEGECEEGKRLVIDTILNRLDSDKFPNTIYEVIFQENQFSCVSNGRLTRCYIDDDICGLIKEELNNRTDYNVVYFTANGYGKYGKPLVQVGNHYFSTD